MLYTSGTKNHSQKTKLRFILPKKPVGFSFLGNPKNLRFSFSWESWELFNRSKARLDPRIHHCGDRPAVGQRSPAWDSQIFRLNESVKDVFFGGSFFSFVFWGELVWWSFFLESGLVLPDDASGVSGAVWKFFSKKRGLFGFLEITGMPTIVASRTVT